MKKQTMTVNVDNVLSGREGKGREGREGEGTGREGKGRKQREK